MRVETSEERETPRGTIRPGGKLNEDRGTGQLVARRRLLKLVGIGGAAVGLGGGYLAYLAATRQRPGTSSDRQFQVSPYISQQEHLDSLPAPRLSFYKQPWRGYLQTVAATQFLSGIGMNYSLPAGTKHEPVLQLLADSGVSHIRVELPWAEVRWDERGLINPDTGASIFTACKKHRIVPLILLNAHHGVPGPAQWSERTLISGGERGSRAVVLDSVQKLTPGRSGLSNLSQYKMCEALITDIDPASRTVKLSRPLPNAIAGGSKVTVNTLKYLPLYPVGTPEFAETMAGWLRYVDLALRTVVESGVKEFDVEIWNELTFGSDYLSINNYYEKPVASMDRDFLHKGGQAWELGKQTADHVKHTYRGARVIWGFSNVTFYHTRVADLPAGVDGQSYHPYGTDRIRIPRDFPPKNTIPLFIEGFVPRVTRCMPEGWAHLATSEEQLIRGMLQPSVRAAALPPGAPSFAHYMTEHGFAPGDVGLTDRNKAQAYKAKALIRALTFWLNKGISRMDIFTAYQDSDLLMGILWSDPRPPAYHQSKPVRSPALRALKNLVGQFEGAEALSQLRQLDVSVTALGEQHKAFQGDSWHPPLHYREMFTFLPFQVRPRRFVVATYVMSYDATSLSPPMRFRLEIKGVDGRKATCRYYDPIQDRHLQCTESARGKASITLTVEQVDYPRLIVIDEG